MRSQNSIMPENYEEFISLTLQLYPCKTKTSQETQRSLQKFLEPTRNPKVIYTDNSLEFGKACEDLCWNHCTSTPHRSETNGIAERAVRRVKGTSAVWLQSRLDDKWWADSMECYTYLRNVQDLLAERKLRVNEDLENHLKDQLFQLVHWLNLSQIPRETKREFINAERKYYQGFSAGYASIAGGIWKGRRIRKLGCIRNLSQKTQRKRSPDTSIRRRICISCGRWFSKIIRERLRIPRTHTETGIHRKERESQRRISRRLGRVSTSMKQKMTQESIKTSGLLKVIILNREFNFFVPRDESFPIPLKYVDVIRSTHTDLDVAQEKRIDDYWNVDGSRNLSDSWTGFTRFTLLDETTKLLEKDTCGPGERLTKIQTTSRPDCFWPDAWTRIGKAAQRRETQEWEIEKPKLEYARNLRGVHSVDPGDEEYKNIIKHARRKSETAAMPCKRPFSKACIRETVVSKTKKSQGIRSEE